MTTDPRKENPEIPSPEALATQQDVASFVQDAVNAFKVTGEQYAVEPMGEEKAYSLFDGQYDAEKTPHIAPYDSVFVEAAAYDDPNFSSALFSFTTVLPHSERGLVEVSRLLTLSGSGDVIDITRTSGIKSKIAEKLQGIHDALNEMDIPFEFKVGAYALALNDQLAMDEFIDDAEGMPKEPEQITYAELDDLRKLLPTPKSV